MNTHTSRLTVIIPAYNEVDSLADTLESLRAQSLQPEEVIVVDDCSTDGTGDLARRFGVTVLCPPKNTGTKAGAQNFALQQVRTEYTMAIDADTTLEPDAIALLMPAFREPGVVAACGMVIPRHVRTLWERGRYVEYMFAFSFFKPVQDYFERPLISSGCFSAYRTYVLQQAGGWPTRTMAEDMDLTWTFYSRGHKVRFIPEAVCYPVEPHTYSLMSKQLRRWSHGFVKNVRVHWQDLLRVPFLGMMVGVALWDSIIASLAYLLLIPALGALISPWFLLAYVIDAPAIAFPVLLKAGKRKEFQRACASIPSYFLLRTVNSVFLLRAFWCEWVAKRPLTVYEKGH